MQILEALNKRYAAKKMTGQIVPQQKIDTILEAIRLAPSSGGMQPYKVVVVSDHMLKGRIHDGACRQPQVVEGSHFLVFASMLEVDAAYIDEQIALVAATRDLPVESLAPFADSVKGAVSGMTAEQQAIWAARQAYIALGVGVVAAAAEGVDATPMEGFDKALMDELLGLKEQNLQSVVVMALGYRDEEKDFLAHAKKVRKPADKFFIKHD